MTSPARSRTCHRAPRSPMTSTSPTTRSRLLAMEASITEVTLGLHQLRQRLTALEAHEPPAAYLTESRLARQSHTYPDNHDTHYRHRDATTDDGSPGAVDSDVDIDFRITLSPPTSYTTGQSWDVANYPPGHRWRLHGGRWHTFHQLTSTWWSVWFTARGYSWYQTSSSATPPSSP